MTTLLTVGLTTVVAPNPDHPTHKRVVFVIDRSGSMRGQFSETMEAWRLIARAPVDDMELCVYAFGKHWARFPPEGYLQLPDADKLRAAEMWLATVDVGSWTNVRTPLALAIKEPGPRTVVLVTDGEFMDEAEVGKEPVRVLAIGEAPESLLEIGKNGGGVWLLSQK